MNRPETFVFREPVTVRSTAMTLYSAFLSRLSLLLTQDRKPNQRENIKKYYQLQRYKEVEEDIVDGSHDHYFDYVKWALNGKAINDPSVRQILDLGCGQAKLAEILETHPKIESYIGIDLTVSERSREELSSDNATLFETDVLEFDYDGLDLDETLAICVNTLCYLESSKQVATLFSNLSARRLRYLTIVEPNPGFFWETFFNGIKIKLRHPRRMREILDEFNMKEVRSTQMFRLKIFGKPLWRVAYSLTYKSDQTPA